MQRGGRGHSSCGLVLRRGDNNRTDKEGLLQLPATLDQKHRVDLKERPSCGFIVVSSPNHVVDATSTTVFLYWLLTSPVRHFTRKMTRWFNITASAGLSPYPRCILVHSGRWLQGNIQTWFIRLDHLSFGSQWVLIPSVEAFGSGPPSTIWSLCGYEAPYGYKLWHLSIAARNMCLQ